MLILVSWDLHVGKLLAHQHQCYQLRVMAHVVVSYLAMQAAMQCTGCRQKDLSMRLISCLIATWPSQCGLLKQSCSQYTLAAQQAVRLVQDIAGATSWQRISGRRCSWQRLGEAGVHHETDQLNVMQQWGWQHMYCGRKTEGL